MSGAVLDAGGLGIAGLLGRRTLGSGAGAALLAASPGGAVARPRARPVVVMLVYPGMVLLDLVGPLTAFGIMGADTHLVWADRTPVATDVGIPVQPTSILSDAAAGGCVVRARRAGRHGRCDGPAGGGGLRRRVRGGGQVGDERVHGQPVAGRGRAAARLRRHLALLHGGHAGRVGSVARRERVVTDRNRMTGGGVTAGLDFSLTLAAQIAGDDAAKRIQLLLEYAPEPPFQAGSRMLPARP